MENSPPEIHTSPCGDGAGAGVVLGIVGLESRGLSGCGHRSTRQFARLYRAGGRKNRRTENGEHHNRS